eukprot:scaffold8243_cov129-Isochrysis_galbana.AAC.16
MVPVPPTLTHVDLARLRVTQLASALAHFTENSLEALAGRHTLLHPVEPQPVLAVGAARRDSCHSAQVTLVEGDRHGRVNRQVELGVALPPVLDQRDVCRRGNGERVGWVHVKVPTCPRQGVARRDAKRGLLFIRDVALIIACVARVF